MQSGTMGNLPQLEVHKQLALTKQGSIQDCLVASRILMACAGHSAGHLHSGLPAAAGASEPGVAWLARQIQQHIRQRARHRACPGA